MRRFLITLLLLLAIDALAQDIIWHTPRRRVRAVASGGETPTPYSWWKMIGTDTNATQLLDFYGHHDMSNMPNVATGPAFFSNDGTYYVFDGSEDHFVSTNAPIFSSTNKTITAWIYRYSYVASSVRPIFSKYDPGGGKSEYMFYTYGSNLIGLVENPTETKYIRTVSAALPINQWLHVAMTWDGGTNVYLYTNGILSVVTMPNTGGFTGSDYAAQVTKPMIGRAMAFYASGSIQDVRYYNQTLSSQQVWGVKSLGRATP